MTETVHASTNKTVPVNFAGIMAHRLIWISALLILITVNLSSQNPATDRGFTGDETEHGVSVTSTAVAVLNSRLTQIFFPVVYIIVFSVGLPANAMAIWVFLFRTKKKHPSSIFMANLALADLLFVIWIPLKIAYHFNGNHWIYGEALCKVLVGFFYGNMYCSTAFIACISVQRYWAIVHPLSQQKRNNKLAAGVSVCVWLVVWVITVPLFLYDQTVKVTNMNIVTCHDVTRPSQSRYPSIYFLIMGVVGFIVPCIICIVAYVQMLRALKSSMTDTNIVQKRRKAVILIVTVLVMFLVCFTPSNIMVMVHYSLLLMGVQDSGYGFYITTLCLASLNSCVDPFVYYFISDEFREHVRNTFLCRSERTAQRMRVSFSALKYSKKNSTYTSESGNTQSTSY
ncbi:proteinase-activated receptor 2-like [Cyprinus carpio]|uniref:Coagulation factor II (thrombin) receptor-like 1, tandem duplicate 1 n=1 Tax=Cyprinus carpio TaxID=7962 RepID=A0A8C1XQJ3_CYPCA|nr:proteinase-activated receptor 2-like [Cyprinus carpio]